MVGGSKKQDDLNRLRADVAAAAVELLSAHCAVDRVRLRYSVQDVVSFTERQSLKRAIASAEALCDFFSQIEAHIKEREHRDHP